MPHYCAACLHTRLDDFAPSVSVESVSGKSKAADNNSSGNLHAVTTSTNEDCVTRQVMGTSEQRKKLTAILRDGSTRATSDVIAAELEMRRLARRALQQELTYSEDIPPVEPPSESVSHLPLYELVYRILTTFTVSRTNLPGRESITVKLTLEFYSPPINQNPSTRWYPIRICLSYTEVGHIGSKSDGGVFQKYSLWRPMGNGLLPDGYYLVEDNAFPLKLYAGTNQPLSVEGKIFNYCLSRTRRIVENVFRILVRLFQVFQVAVCGWPSVVFEEGDVCRANSVTTTGCKTPPHLSMSSTSFPVSTSCRKSIHGRIM
ncbi:hypothetical protein PR048_032463 [Dryococelus australis]|uniref:DDE Tnp4 domain-containing protein n=1 Tax=Dryococelus australis TaxID=614101 RepID=A0ABQ9G291_9NEOP|nr:hypothetical protein PR048_032463 [Dryococelus australis]